VIPVFIIGGYLGSGKTTLLNRLLNDARGVRYAVLVNDFGSMNVDSELIASTGAQTIELTNGCSCCTIGGDLILALKNLLERADPPERIVIEASGIADPGAVARLAAAHPDLCVQGTIVLADAETIQARAGDRYVGDLVRRQLGASDAIVLSKIDLVDASQLAAVREWLGRTVPGVPAFEAVKGEGLPDLLLDAGVVTALRKDVAESRDRHHALFASAAFVSNGALDRAAFLNAVRVMSQDLVRAKGTLHFTDAPEMRYLFQLVGEHWSLEPIRIVDPTLRAQIVAIALAERSAQLPLVIDALRAAAPLEERTRYGT